MSMLCVSLFGCTETQPSAEIVATTLPVYEFTELLCDGTNLSIKRLITEDISCLHDYSINVTQMQAMESAELLITSGVELESFLEDINVTIPIVDASKDIPLLSTEHSHEDSHAHSHSVDPHYWLAPECAKIMATNICEALAKTYPEHKVLLFENLKKLEAELNELTEYADAKLNSLSCRELITFHDGFAYMAEAYNLEILHAVEEESGSEASAAELIELINLVKKHHLPAVFTERNGSVSAATIIAAETDISIFTLDMAMSGDGYFDAMYSNIDTLSEALK